MNKKNLVKESYNTVAETYSANRDQFKNNAYLDELIKLLKLNSTILDIGCGAGMPVDRYLVDHGHNVIGIDISEKQIELARKNVPEGKFAVKDMSDLEFGTYQVDAVVSFYAIFHIAKEEHLELLKKIHSFLKPGGFMLITMGASEWEGIEDFHGVQMAWSHYGPKKNLKLVRDAGFEIIKSTVDTSGDEKHLVILAKKIIKITDTFY